MEYTIRKLSVKNCYWLANQNPTQVNPFALFELFYTQSCFFFSIHEFLDFCKVFKESLLIRAISDFKSASPRNV